MPKPNKPFWQVIKAKKEPKAELLIYGEISSFMWWGDETTPKEVNDILNEIGEVDELSVRINSPGGEVFAGMAIYSMLKRHSANVTAYIDGLAASISSVIPLAANKIVMMRGAMYMIHKPMVSAWGSTADKLRAKADLLDKIEGEMTGIYVERSGMTAEQIAPLLTAETWYTADEAKAAGFIDEVEGDSAVAACLRGETAVINGVEVNWKQFANAPTLPEAVSPPAVDHIYKIAARQRELELIYRR